MDGKQRNAIEHADLLFNQGDHDMHGIRNCNHPHSDIVANHCDSAG
ncbi:MAG: hypothetical protein WC379_16980 [Methanoregula sp.]